MITAECVIPTADGCSAICPIPVGFVVDEGADLNYRYERDGLTTEYGGILVKLPITLFDHLLSTIVEEEEAGTITHLHLYGKLNDYEGFFFGTLAVQAEEFIKAKGVAAYLASTP